MSASHICPRRTEGPWKFLPAEDRMESDDTCSYCGSLNPATFMSRLEAGDVEVIPTDKNYKAYVRNRGGAMFLRRSRTDDDRSGDRSKWVWATREIDQTKFYYQHLTEDQMRRFIELVNERRLHLAEPGHFYVMPFFMRLEPRS